MKVSIIIPCHPSHFAYLDSLISIYEKQTVLPYEIIIALSETDKVCKRERENLQKKPRKFEVVLLKTKTKQTAGQNRNRANKAARGEILINQDADDLPHEQRVEIILYFFKKFDLDVLFHRHSLKPLKNSFLEKKQIDYFFPKHHLQRTSHFNPGFVCLSKKIAQELPWPPMLRKADMVYSIQLFQNSQKILAIDAFLIEYRISNSTYSAKRQNFNEEQLEQAKKEEQFVNQFILKNVPKEFETGLKWLSVFCGNQLDPS